MRKGRGGGEEGRAEEGRVHTRTQERWTWEGCIVIEICGCLHFLLSVFSASHRIDSQ